MNEVEHIVDQHRRALEGEAWHGPALREVLKGVTAKRAVARPLADAHSIWELVLHIEAWDRAVLGRLAGKPIELSDEEDWPRIRDKSAAAWKRAIQSMEATHIKLTKAIAALTPGRLDESFVPGQKRYVFNLVHGIIQHEIYHAGQIALLKKG